MANAVAIQSLQQVYAITMRWRNILDHALARLILYHLEEICSQIKDSLYFIKPESSTINCCQI